MLARRKLLAALLVSASAGVAGCATAVAPETLQMVESQDMSAVILSYRQFREFTMARVIIANTATRQTYAFSQHAGFNVVGERPANLIAVPPGRYRVVQGYLYSGSASAGMPLVEHWFKDFEVRPGEVLDLGTLTLDAIDLHSIANARGIEALLRFGDDSDTTTYVAYGVDNSADSHVRELLEARYPSLVGKPVARPLETALNRAQFESILVEAYSPSEGGTPPDTSAARMRVQARLTAFLGESR